jgi:hypothetical protein
MHQRSVEQLLGVHFLPVRDLQECVSLNVSADKVRELLRQFHFSEITFAVDILKCVVDSARFTGPADSAIRMQMCDGFGKLLIHRAPA